jgi:hypothetical protein
MTTKVNAEAIANFAQVTCPKRVQTTLFSLALRDAANNPELYRETEITEELTALHHLLGNLLDCNEVEP